MSRLGKSELSPETFIRKLKHLELSPITRLPCARQILNTAYVARQVIFRIVTRLLRIADGLPR